jgi:hypothetical protein
MYIDESKGLIHINNDLVVDIRAYCEDCYNHNPEVVNDGIIELIRYTDDRFKSEAGYVPVTDVEIASTMTILEKCWQMNKDKMNLIMDKSIITINKG